MTLPIAPNVTVIYTVDCGCVIAMDNTQGAALELLHRKPAPQILVGGEVWKLVQTWVWEGLIEAVEYGKG